MDLWRKFAYRCVRNTCPPRCSRSLRQSRCASEAAAVRDAAVTPAPPGLSQPHSQGSQCGRTSGKDAIVLPYNGSGSITPGTTFLASEPDLSDGGLQASVCPPADLRRLPVGSTQMRSVRLGAAGRPWLGLHAKLQQSLSSSKLLDTDSVLVAVSGGQDSVALLQALVDLQPRWGWRLGVVHCDHSWRPDSAANAEFVREVAEQRHGLPFHVRVAPPGSVPTERAAREWRYSVFSEVAAAHGYGVVATGHTATDRAETMLLNLLRGSGPDGLVALARSRPLAVEAYPPGPRPHASGEEGPSPSGSSSAAGDCSRVGGTHGNTAVAASAAPHPTPPPPRLARPLLEFSRSDTLEFVQALGLPYYHDTTNDCNDLRRNRLRNEVLPLLRQGFNPRLDQALFRFLEVLSADMDYLERATDDLYDSMVSQSPNRCGDALDSGSSAPEAGIRRGGGGDSTPGRPAAAPTQPGSRSGATALRLSELRRLPLAMQRRVVRKWLEAAMDGGLKGSRACAQGGSGGAVSGAADGGGGGAGCQVRFEDVARCLALLNAPNRANSDSLCGGLVASVRDGHLVLLRARASRAAMGPSRGRPPQQLRPQRPQRPSQERSLGGAQAAGCGAGEEVASLARERVEGSPGGFLGPSERLHGSGRGHRAHGGSVMAAHGADGLKTPPGSSWRGTGESGATQHGRAWEPAGRLQAADAPGAGVDAWHGTEPGCSEQLRVKAEYPHTHETPPQIGHAQWAGGSQAAWTDGRGTGGLAGALQSRGSILPVQQPGVGVIWGGKAQGAAAVDGGAERSWG